MVMAQALPTLPQRHSDTVLGNGILMIFMIVSTKYIAGLPVSIVEMKLTRKDLQIKPKIKYIEIYVANLFYCQILRHHLTPSVTLYLHTRMSCWYV